LEIRKLCIKKNSSRFTHLSAVVLQLIGGLSPKNFLAAVTQAPIASAIIVMEMIDGHEMVISLMAVTLIAKAFSSRLSPELYQRLAVGFRNANDPDHLRSP